MTENSEKQPRVIHTILDKKSLNRTIKRIASEIAEKNQNENTPLVIIGMKTRGEYIANRIIEELKKLDVSNIERGVIDSTLYRDDFRTNLKVPNISINDMPFSIDDKELVLVDDVLFTGRSLLAAINAIMDLGRPSLIEFAVLIDRGLKELPISSNYVGKVVKTLPSQEIRVKLQEVDNEDVVYLVEM